MSESKNVNLRDLLNVYETKCTLPSGVVLEIKPLTTGQLKSLLVYENEKNPIIIENALDALIESAVYTENFSIDDLYLQDRFELMLELRKITKGNVYNNTFKCSKCKGETVINKDLRSLPTKPIKELEYTVKINDRVTAIIGFPTRGHQKKAYKYVGISGDREITSTDLADAASATLAYAIKSILIDGKECDDYSNDNGIEDKIYMLENIPRQYFDDMSNFFKENNFGTEFEFDVTCFHCKDKVTIRIPLNDFFV